MTDPVPQPTPPATSRLRIPVWRLAAVLGAVALLLIVRLSGGRGEPGEPIVEQPASREVVVRLPPTPEPGLLYGPPTPQTDWRDVDNPAVYMPTGSGRVESAGYGSVRTSSSGHASFHEGVDIAPVKWERGRAADDVFAVADGRVAYLNRSGGNSSYGVYAVVTHQDPVGEVVSLYAHLASIRDDLREGDAVKRGDVIGRMGHSSTLGIPPQRSHLHLEMGMILNARFDRWFSGKGLTPSHSRYHGWNIAGFDPRRMLFNLHGGGTATFSYLRTLRELPAAWRILLPARRLPDYFTRHPELWDGPAFRGGAMVIDVSESGIPLVGRAATADERALLSGDSPRILEVNEEALGRNGFRHVQKSGGGWRLGRNGEQWLDILLYGTDG